MTKTFVQALRIRWWHLAVPYLAPFLLGAQTPAQTNSYIPEQTLISGRRELEFLVPTNGLIHFGIVRTNAGPAESRIKVTAGRFRSDRDSSEIVVRLNQTDVVFPSNEFSAVVTMQVPPSALATNYKGLLFVSGAGSSPLFWPVTLTSGSSTGKGPGTLVLDQTTLPHSFRTRWYKTNAWFLPKLLRPSAKILPQVNVTLHEKNYTWPIHGISVSYGSANAPDHAQFDIGKNVAFFFNGTRITNLAQWPAGDQASQSVRSIAENGRAELGLAFPGIRPGQYTFDITLHGANSLTDLQQQKLTINLKVAHTFGLALLTLVASLLLSFFAYKFLKLFRQRLEIQRRIDELSPDWLPAQRRTYSVVWVLTVLEQAKELAAKLLMVPPNLITARVDRTVPVIKALDAARKARLVLQGFDPLVVKRFEAVIADTVRSISERNMDSAAAEKAEAELTALAAEIEANRWMDRYWDTLQKAVNALLLRFAVNNLQADSRPAAEQKLNHLRPGGNPPPKPPTLSDMVAYEEVYAKLKLLVERQNDDAERGQILAKFDRRLEEVFLIADEGAWKRIKNAKLDLVMPTCNTRAYLPLYFELTTQNKELDATYLFQRGLHFKWTFQLRKPVRKPVLNFCPFRKKEKGIDPFVVHTFSPRTVYFAQQEGELVVNVKIIHQSPSGPEEKDIDTRNQTPVPIEKSTEIRWLRGFEWTEWASLGIAAVLALLSGLLAFYYKNPTFGSVQDYLGLFLWGVGVEQTKNFLQAMQPSST